MGLDNKYTQTEQGKTALLTVQGLLATKALETAKPTWEFAAAAASFTANKTFGTLPTDNDIKIPSSFSGTTGVISGAYLFCDAIIASMQVDCFLFDAPVAWTANNVIPNLTYANGKNNLVSVIRFSSARAIGTNNILLGEINHFSQFNRNGADTVLYPYFVASGSFTVGVELNCTLLLDTL